MMSLYCTASMLPCGRYYYDPEGGYVGNPWVKISYQFIYLYLGWFIHHLDLFDHYIFQFSQTLIRKCSSYSSRTLFARQSSLNEESSNEVFEK
jgi:hypothetical protein